jgi:hypothetical protein
MDIEKAKDYLENYNSKAIKSDFTKALNVILEYIDELEKKVQSND